MARNVKRTGREIGAKRSATGSAAAVNARISSKHQITIGKPAFTAAGFSAGDVVSVRAVGPGRVELTSLDAHFDKHRGRLSTGGAYRQTIEELRDEWA